MELSEAIELIKNPSISKEHSAIWADLGCGSGLFTAALAHLLSPGSLIYAVDKTPVRLDASLLPKEIEIRTMQLDFVEEMLPMRQLDGILMANSLHYVQDKSSLIKALSAAMKPGGRFLIVEYDTDRPVKQWVPYPVGFNALKRLFANAGYPSTAHLGERDSVFGQAKMYAALASPP